MNGLEFLVAGVFLLVTCLFLLWLLKDWKAALGITALMIIPTLLAAEYTVQVLTVDEAIIVLEVSWAEVRQWDLVAMRTSYVVLGFWSRFLRKFFEEFVLDRTRLYQSMLAAHWLLTTLSLLPITALISLEFTKPQDRKLTVGMLLPAMVIFPVTVHALKVFNYDALSMTLGVLSLLLSLAALRKPRGWMALLAVLSGFLATQEKLSAFPILFLALIVAGISAGDGYTGWKRLLAVVVGSLIGVSVAAVTGMISAMVFGWLANQAVWTYFGDAVEPLMQWWVTLSGFMGGAEQQAGDLLGYVPLLVLIIVIISVALSWTRDRLPFQLEDPAPGWASRAYAVTVGLMLVAGILGLYVVHAYYAPAQPIAPGAYRPPADFNTLTLHFGAASHVTHILSYIAYSYAWFVTALPTALLLLVIAIGVFPARIPLDLLGALLLSALFPLAYALAGLPVLSRYFNIWLLLMAIVMIVQAAAILNRKIPRFAWALPVVLTVLMVAEYVPFRPVGFSFRPVWAVASMEQVAPPEVGRVYPLWPSSGEEITLVGRYMSDTCGTAPGQDDGLASQPCDQITLYPLYRGRWLADPATIRINIAVNIAGIPEYPEAGPPVTALDYYVLNRNAISQGRAVPDIAPEYIVAYRGYAIAWLYRGDKLAEAGYQW